MVATIADPADLLIHSSLALKTEIADCFAELAEQLENFNNSEAADTFLELIRHQKHHIQRLETLVVERDQPQSQALGNAQDSPADDINANSHYLMTPYHAVELALNIEQSSQQTLLAQSGIDANDEQSQPQQQEHARYILFLQQLLSTLPAPESHWHEDLDPPNLDE